MKSKQRALGECTVSILNVNARSEPKRELRRRVLYYFYQNDRTTMMKLKIMMAMEH